MGFDRFKPSYIIFSILLIAPILMGNQDCTGDVDLGGDRSDTGIDEPGSDGDADGDGGPEDDGDVETGTDIGDECIPIEGAELFGGPERLSEARTTSHLQVIQRPGEPVIVRAMVLVHLTTEGFEHGKICFGVDELELIRDDRVIATVPIDISASVHEVDVSNYGEALNSYLTFEVEFEDTGDFVDVCSETGIHRIYAVNMRATGQTDRGTYEAWAHNPDFFPAEPGRPSVELTCHEGYIEPFTRTCVWAEEIEGEWTTEVRIYAPEEQPIESLNSEAFVIAGNLLDGAALCEDYNSMGWEILEQNSERTIFATDRNVFADLCTFKSGISVSPHIDGEGLVRFTGIANGQPFVTEIYHRGTYYNE